MSATATEQAPITATEAVVMDFEFSKNTPNTVKFDEVEVPGQPKKVGTLYMQKWVHHNLGTPARVQVTVRAK